jgi:hypothetical protein
MKHFINRKQLASNLKKYGFLSFDNEVLDDVNNFEENFLNSLLKKTTEQKGGRVSMPIEFFGGITNNYSTDVPKFTNISSSDVALRQEIPLNDPTNILGTEKAMDTGLSGGASQQKFKVSKTASKQVVDDFLHKNNVSIKNKKQFIEGSKQKFEMSMHEIFTNVQQKLKGKNHLKAEDLKKTLNLKKFKSLKA